MPEERSHDVLLRALVEADPDAKAADVIRSVDLERQQAAQREQEQQQAAGARFAALPPEQQQAIADQQAAQAMAAWYTGRQQSKLSIPAFGGDR